MTRLNSKIEIINYFDYLMSRVDNDIRKSSTKTIHFSESSYAIRSKAEIY